MKLYIVVNKDLPMSTGKIAGQVAHAVTEWVYVNSNKPEFFTWLHNNNQVKIILKASEKDLLKLEEQYNTNFLPIRDAGKTEIPEDSLTCICLGLWEREDLEKEIKEAKRWRLL